MPCFFKSNAATMQAKATNSALPAVLPGDGGGAISMMTQLAALATVPVPDLPISLDELQAMANQLEGLTTIQDALGPDVPTPGGAARVNARLSCVAQ